MKIKESIELIDLIIVLSTAIREANRDGVVNWMDIPKFAPVIIAAKKAIEGSDKIEDEIRDLSAEDSRTLAVAALTAGQALIYAILHKPKG
tara:strand:- start:1108 stop:1380 length:273 start_codon:yes stop_codon:yes gene_type:complete